MEKIFASSYSSTQQTRSGEVPVYAGSEVLAFQVVNMPPNIRIFTYVNGVNITPFTGPNTTTATLGEEIKTDQNGTAGGFLYIPSTEGQFKFPVGEIRLTFGDSPVSVADCKFVSETILMNHGINLVDTEQGGSISLRTTEKFRTDVSGSSGDKNTTLKRLDPLTQTFIVDSEKHPLGVVVTGLALFFTAKDTNLPIGVELRPMDGAVPSTTEYFSGTSVFVNAADVKLVTTKSSEPTNFTFYHPIYLKPGEYAFSVITQSAKYKLLCSGKAAATTGKGVKSIASVVSSLQTSGSAGVVPVFGTITSSSTSFIENAAVTPSTIGGKIPVVFTAAQQKVIETNKSKYPAAFAGRLYKAQNTGAWFADLNQDLTFYLRKAKFNTGSVTFEMQSSDVAEIDYNRLRFLTTEVSLGDTAFVDYKIQTTNDNVARDKNEFKKVNAGDLVDLTGRQSIKNAGDIKLQVTMTSKSSDVSPILDAQLLKAQIFRNNITEYSDEISQSELRPYGGTAKSRYVSKIVTLQEGFDSTGLEVKVDVNRQVGTDIDVYARVLARDDKSFTDGIQGRPWVKMPLVAPAVKSFAGTDATSFTTETYRLLEPSLTYTSNSNVQSNIQITSTYEDFSQYQVKIVFYSNNPAYLPKLKRLVATSVL